MSRTTLDSVLRVLVFAYQALTVFGSLSQEIWLTFPPILSVLNPGAVSRSGLGFARFARRYWGHLF